MGRRKIEIKPIRDDRNRSVTFLKRKGGLFKKAHELSVLCSVDVAVVIFGHNKKLYEYSSSDINEIIGRFQYYGGAHEHKGPADFADKTGGDDDDEDGEGGDDMGGDEHHRGTPQPDASMMHPHMANHPGFQHVRHGTPHASPPMHNGAMPQFTRGPSPLPPGMTVSRPNSRNAQHPGGPQHIRRTSSNLGPQHPPGAPPSYAYQPNPPFYNPQAAQMAGRPPPGAIPPPGAFPAPYPPQPPQHPHMQQAFMEEQRRTPMPPNFAPQPAPPPPNMQTHSSGEHLAPPGQQAHPSPRLQQQQRPTPSPQPPQGEFQSPPLPQPKPMPAHAKTHSIFTPIDDSRSMLAQHWGGPSNAESRPDPAIKIEGGGPRSQSIDVAQMQRDNHARANGLSPRPPPSVPPPATQSATQSPQPPHRTVSTPIVAPPARSGTQQTEAKRPRLKVQIPSEQSGDEGGTAESAQDTASEAQTANTTAGQPQVPPHGVVLPPPSPSAGALLSAGAQGPPNPFARPAPPMSTNPHAANREANHIETPLSALPSRFMNNELLPSPSAFYPSDWNTNMLPSPFTFQTPVAGNGPSWRTEEEQRKRANDDLAAEDGGDPKRAKT